MCTTWLKCATNTLATQVYLKRIGKTQDETCRICKQEPETVKHAMGNCPGNEQYRMGDARTKAHHDVWSDRAEFLKQHVKEAGFKLWIEHQIDEIPELEDLHSVYGSLKPDGVAYSPTLKRWILHDFTRGTPNAIGTATHLSAQKANKKEYIALCEAMRRRFPDEQVVFIPLAVTYEGVFDLRHWVEFTEMLGMKEDTQEEFLYLTARSVVLRLGELNTLRREALLHCEQTHPASDNGHGGSPNGASGNPTPNLARTSTPATRTKYRTQGQNSTPNAP